MRSCRIIAAKSRMESSDLGEDIREGQTKGYISAIPLMNAHQMGRFIVCGYVWASG
jgi:hypothetical protein